MRMQSFCLRSLHMNRYILLVDLLLSLIVFKVVYIDDALVFLGQPFENAVHRRTYCRIFGSYPQVAVHLAVVCVRVLQRNTSNTE